MKILITGSEGQLGRSLAPLLAKHQVEAHDRPTLDLTDPAAVARMFQTFKPDLVINTAAYTAVDKAETDVTTADQINHLAAATLAQESARHGARLIHISTDFVFDGTRGQPYPVDADCHPVSVYGKTKLDGELAIRQILPENSYIIRTAWLYSEFGHNFVKTMLKLMQERPQLKIVADQTGSPTSAHTLAQFITQLMTSTATPGIYHCTDAGIASWYDFAVAIHEEGMQAGILPHPVEILPIPTSDYPVPAKRPHYSVLDKGKSYATGLLKPIHWRTTLRQTIATLAAQQTG